jgi:ABC-type nitrate/sulfonate/bicarbonate transport system permease component
MYVGVIAMSLLGFGMYYAVDWAEWRLCKWKFVG